jgi:hypothetical protein
MIAAINWEFRIYSQTLGFTGVRLNPLLYFQQPLESTSICVQLSTGNGESLFYSLRLGLEAGKKTAKVYRLYKKDEAFEEEAIVLKDPSAHLMIARGDSFAALGQVYLTYFNKGKTSQIKIPQAK